MRALSRSRDPACSQLDFAALNKEFLMRVMTFGLTLLLSLLGISLLWAQAPA